MKKLLCVLFVFLISGFATSEDSSCPHHSGHQNVQERGDHEMGFDHEKTIHHFKLKPDGGFIVAEAKDSSNKQSIDQIRKHFVEITGLFSRGDFSKPEKIHGRVPPGVPEMIEYAGKILYDFRETPNGGEVRIKTENAQVLKAIHSFLRFQIEDHQTGDPLTVQ